MRSARTRARSTAARRPVAVAATVLAIVTLVIGAARPATAAVPAAGADWTTRTPSSVDQWYSVAYGNGVFVAVASSGTNRVMTSPDGVTWTAQVAAEANSWRAVTFGNGLFVAVAASGANRVMTSPDGVTWTAHAAAAANTWQAVTFGGGIFVAVSSAATDAVMTSPDGVTWTARSAAAASNWLGLTYGGGQFVAVAIFSGGTNVMTSPDGIIWTGHSSPVTFLSGVTYGNGTYVAVSVNGANRVATSTDGVTWTARTAAEANYWRSVAYGDGMFVAVASNGTNRVMTSPDGVTWTAHAASAASDWYFVAYAKGMFVATATAGTDRLMTSGALRVVPEAPSALVATAGDGAATISFTPGSSGSSPVTAYQVKVGNGSWVDADGTTSPVTVSGLTNYTTTRIRLRAVNAVGPGAMSAPVAVRPRAAAPSLDSVSATGRTSAHVEYSGVTISDATVSGYRATAFVVGTNTAVASCNTKRNGRTCDIHSLARGTQYDIRVIGYFRLPGDTANRQTLESTTLSVTTTN